MIALLKVNIITTAGFSKKLATIAMSVMGLSEMIGKIAFGFISDRLPIPKIFLLIFANVAGVGAMVMMLCVATKISILCQAACKYYVIFYLKNYCPNSSPFFSYSSLPLHHHCHNDHANHHLHPP